MDIQIGRSITSIADLAMEREWLVTNGIGGYASGTIAGARTRRYHGLLVAALNPPLERYLLLGAVDAWLEIGNRRIPIATHEWAAGVLFPDGYRNLEQFRLEDTLPVFRWAFGITRIEQRIWMAHGANTTYLTWRYERGIEPVRLILKPLVSCRSHHDVTVGGKSVKITTMPSPWKKGLGIEVLASQYLGKETRNVLPVPMRILTTEGTLNTNGDWWWAFQLREEKARGLDAQEDLYQIGTIEMTLAPGDMLGMACTVETTIPDPPEVALQIERERLAALGRVVGLGQAPAWIQQLALAADQFIVENHQNEKPETTVISGYPWFGIWFRDMLAALAGLTLGRPKVAEAVLRSCLGYVNEGMLPNTIDEEGNINYNAIDPALWYFVALWMYLQENPDNTHLLETVYPTLRTIIQYYSKGTRYHIGEDPTDGLLFGGERGLQLTWMDVKINNWVVTPRTGKDVEVNALWYNALRIMQDFAERLGIQADINQYTTRANRVQQSFNHLFWCAEKGYLYDVIDIPDRPNDATLRPNQLLALSLPFPVLIDAERSKQVVDSCARELLVSYGLRTLHPDDNQFIGQYTGSPEQRDRAYHQGTVWGWLIGPFVRAYLVVYQDPVTARSFIEPFADNLRIYGIGTISEIFDANSPFRARGAIAQAWSVAELLRVWREIEQLEAIAAQQP